MRTSSRSSNIPVDGEKLKEEFEKRGINFYEFGTECGYSRKWFQNAIHNNYVSPPMVVVLKDKLGVSLEDIQPTVEEPKTVAPGRKEGVLYVSDMTQGDLYETIYDAVVAALGGVKSDQL